CLGSSRVRRCADERHPPRLCLAPSDPSEVDRLTAGAPRELCESLSRLVRSAAGRCRVRIIHSCVQLESGCHRSSAPSFAGPRRPPPIQPPEVLSLSPEG